MNNNFSYEENEKILSSYIEECRNRIKNTFFNEDELKMGTSIKKDLINQGIITSNTKTEEALKIHRNNLIDIKLNHTMRIVEDVTKMAQKMRLNVDFTKVLKVSALLHDIARFDQATWANSFQDRECKQFNGMYHAEFGYHILHVNKRINDFKIPEKFKIAVMQPVRYHQIPNITGDLALRFSDKKQLDVNKILTGNENLNEAEKIIVATLVQMVKDVDMLDILYQHLTGEFPVTRPYVTYDIENGNISEVSKYWGVSEKEILEYNGLTENFIEGKKSIRIPANIIETSKLEIPEDIKQRYFSNIDMDLKELQARNDYTFITGMWWRLNHFLNNINFVSNLEVVEENELLDKIFATYPDIYKPLVEPAFAFAKEVLIKKTMELNQGNIYVNERPKSL